MEFVREYHKRAMRSVQIVVVVAFGLIACLGVSVGMNDTTIPVMFLIVAVAVVCVAVLVLRIQRMASAFNRYLDEHFSAQRQKEMFAAYLEGLGFANSSFAGRMLVCLDGRNPHLVNLDEVEKVWAEQKAGSIPGIQSYRLCLQLRDGNVCWVKLSRGNYSKFLPDIAEELTKVNPSIDCTELRK